MVCTAFQVTEEDIEHVLLNYSQHLINTQGKSFKTLASELIIDRARIERAALIAGCDLDEQTTGAYDEIKKLLIEMGLLEF